MRTRIARPAALTSVRSGWLEKYAVVVFAAWSISSISGSAVAQLPAARLDGLFPPGGAVGQTLDVQIFGGDLDDVDRLEFSHAGIKAELKMAEPGPFDDGPQVVDNTFNVTIGADVPPGSYSVRCRGKYGLSGPRTFLVGAQTAVLEVEPNNLAEKATEIASLPVVVDGRLNATADVDWYAFPGQAGQRLLVDCLAWRIDSRLDAVATLTTGDGRVLAISRREHAGDPLIDVTLPSSGTYRLKIEDSLHTGGGEFSYRLMMGSFPVIDFVFPPAGLAGSNDEYTVYGRNLPGGQPAGLARRGVALEKLTVRVPLPAEGADRLAYRDRLLPHQAGLDGVEVRVTGPQGMSNPGLVTYATAPLVLEQADNDQPSTAQKLVPPCEVAGQFYPRRDVDWYSFEAKQGDEYWIEVTSHRLGTPCDPLLMVQRVERDAAGEEKLTQLHWVDDSGTRQGGPEFDERSQDPSLRFVAPEDGEYRILVRDGYAALVDDPSLVYRLAVRQPQPDFRLAAVPADASGSLLIRKGGRETVRVVVFRQDGFDGEIQLTAEGMPPGVSASEFLIGPAANMGMLVLTAEAGAAGGTGNLRITGKAKVGDRDVARVARLAHPLQAVPLTQPGNNGQPGVASRLTDDLLVVVSDTETARVAMTLEDPGIVETSRSGVVKFKVNVNRQDGAGGNLIGFMQGLPPNINLPQVNLGGNNQAEFEIRLQANTPPGTYSFALAGMLQGMTYSRNPEAAEKAKQRQERIGKLFMEAQQKTNELQQAAQQAKNAVNQANTLVQQATNQRNTAQQLAQNTAAAAKAAMDAAATARQKQADDPENAGLKQQLQTAESKLEEADRKAQQAAEAAAEADAKLEESLMKQKEMQAASVQADEELEAARRFQQQAQQEKQRVDQQAQQAQQQSNPRAFNLIIPSTPARIRIAEYPIKLSGPPESAKLKQGEKLEIPVNVQRLYGFDQNVNFQLVLPGGVSGLQITNLNLPGNQADGVLAVQAQEAATPGEHLLTLRAQMNFNGQGLTLDQPLRLEIEKVEKEQPSQ
jgi:hypothetical protein